jgi:ABC-type lipoprotein release transport system permease subunit
VVWRLAFRNLLRNPRRTGIVIAAVSVGLAGCMLSMAINYGMVIQMVDAAIRAELGHVQIHAAGWEQEPELAVRMASGGAEAGRAVDDLEAEAVWAPRVRSQGLVHSPRASVGVAILGVDPERESRVSEVARKIEAGRWLAPGERKVAVGRRLADRLQADVGDKVVVSVADLDGDLTGQAYRVAGIFRAASSDLDQSTVFLPIDRAQTLLGLDGSVSELVIRLDHERDLEDFRDALAERLGAAVEVRTWRELRPVLVYILEMFDSVAWFLYGAVFIAMAFGIANVLLMAVYERTREIGMLMAVGMSRRRIMAGVVIESVLVTTVGLALGVVLAYASTAALSDGIDLSRWSAGLSRFGVESRIIPVLRGADLWIPVVVALISAVLASAWPAHRAVQTLPADALRHI